MCKSGMINQRSNAAVQSIAHPFLEHPNYNGDSRSWPWQSSGNSILSNEVDTEHDAINKRCNASYKVDYCLNVRCELVQISSKFFRILFLLQLLLLGATTGIKLILKEIEYLQHHVKTTHIQATNQIQSNCLTKSIFKISVGISDAASLGLCLIFNSGIIQKRHK